MGLVGAGVPGFGLRADASAIPQVWKEPSRPQQACAGGREDYDANENISGAIDQARASGLIWLRLSSSIEDMLNSARYVTEMILSRKRVYIIKARVLPAMRTGRLLKDQRW